MGRKIFEEAEKWSNLTQLLEQTIKREEERNLEGSSLRKDSNKAI